VRTLQRVAGAVAWDVARRGGYGVAYGVAFIQRHTRSNSALFLPLRERAANIQSLAHIEQTSGYWSFMINVANSIKLDTRVQTPCALTAVVLAQAWGCARGDHSEPILRSPDKTGVQPTL